MAQLAIATAFAVVGNAIVPGIGGQVGFAIGSMVGGALTAPDIQGPRVDDLRIQLNTYGAPIPKLYGTDRLAGTVIWSTDLIETESEEGGKGGPSTTNYTYSISCAVAIAEGTIKSIRRMWADAKLVYDARAEATDEAKAESTRFRGYWTLYSGGETQTADPTIEAIEGVGNAPAYRGTAYVVFAGLPLADFGNRIPSFSFEVSAENDETATDPADTTVREPLFIYTWEQTRANGWMPTHSLGNNIYGGAGSERPEVATGTDFATVAAAQALAFSTDGAVYNATSGTKSSTFCGFYYTSGTATHPVNGDALHNVGGPDAQYIYLLLTAPDVWRTNEWGLRYIPGGYVPHYDFNAGVGRKTWTLEWPQPIPYGDWQTPVVIWRYLVAYDWGTPTSLTGHQVYSSIGSGLGRIQADANAVLVLRSEREPYHPPTTCRAGDPCEAPEGYAELQGNPDFCVSCAGDVVPNRSWTTVTGTAKQLAAIEYRGGVLYQNALGPVLLTTDPDYSNAAYWDAEAAAAIAAGTMRSDVAYPAVVTSWAESTGSAAEVYEVPGPDSAGVTLSVIVSHICVAAGLTAGQIDVTELTDSVIGYTRTRRMAARAALEPLRAAFSFDAVESGDKIVFRKRARASVASITSEDLGAGEDQAATEAMQHERAQEAELPDALTVSYRSLENDYQPGTQMARRRAGTSDQQATVEVPVVMTDDQARQVAEVLLYSAWIGRNKRTIATTRKWAKIEPTDIIEVDDGDL